MKNNLENETFFKDLKVHKNLKEVLDETNFTDVPSNWYILSTDVKNSTTHIQNNKYKDINFIASMGIMGVVNINKDIPIAYVFGGDGANILVPKSFIEKANKVLIHCQKLAKELYDLELRISSYLLKDLYDKNLDLKVLKHEVSKDYNQTILTGSVLDFIDEEIRNKQQLSSSFDENYEVSFDGLECRWSEINAPKDEVLSLLIKVNNDEIDTYKNVLENIEKYVGSYDIRCPIKNESLKLNNSKKKLRTEVLLKSFKKKNFFAEYFKIVLENLIGLYLFKYGSEDWKSYKSRLLRTCDTEKYENMLKMVISTNYKESKDLIAYLEKEFKNKTLSYGIHKSKSALMTCLIFQRHGNHVHFIDGNNGGFTMASKELKRRIKEL